MKRGVVLAFALFACGPGGSRQQHNPGAPLTVVVDTGKTMSPPGSQGFGGQGVGVFVQYAAGGHWHVFWACDTALSNASCNFDVVMSVADGSITNVSSNGFNGNDNFTATSSEVTATTFTTFQVDAIDFQATPGAKMTVDATIAGLPHDGSFFFFVQDGQVDGNYNGPLSDPLVFEPSSP